MEWEAPGIVLAAQPYGEGDALATVMTEEYGAHRGMVRGGLSRSKANIWQPGNLVLLRWTARLHDQLGAYTAELVHPGAALAMDDAMALSILSSACAVAYGALTEREAHPRVFNGLLHLIVHLGQGQAALTDLIRWEATLLGELGYGLDLSCCALTGATEGLSFVSPRSGHAVCADAAGPWEGRLLKLPGFLVGDSPAAPQDWVHGLTLTGHFLARDAFGLQHKPLPPARLRLVDRVANAVTP
jgi:DNA repair protein RecO (recombination protein O)